MASTFTHVDCEIEIIAAQGGSGWNFAIRKSDVTLIDYGFKTFESAKQNAMARAEEIRAAGWPQNLDWRKSAGPPRSCRSLK